MHCFQLEPGCCLSLLQHYVKDKVYCFKDTQAVEELGLPDTRSGYLFFEVRAEVCRLTVFVYCVPQCELVCCCVGVLVCWCVWADVQVENIRLTPRVESTLVCFNSLKVHVPFKPLHWCFELTGST